MADAIVVLDSDEDDDVPKAVWLSKTKSAPVTNIISVKQRASPQLNAISGKHKLQSSNEIEDNSFAAKRIKTTQSEETTSSVKSIEARKTCNSSVSMPMIMSVETLATPSATPPMQLLASPPRSTNPSRDLERERDRERERELERKVVIPKASLKVRVSSPKIVEKPIIIGTKTTTSAAPTTTNTILTTTATTKTTIPIGTGATISATTTAITPAPTSASVLRRIRPTTILRENDEAWQQMRQKRLQTSASVTSTSTLVSPTIIHAIPNTSRYVQPGIKSPVVTTTTTAIRTTPPPSLTLPPQPLLQSPPLQKQQEKPKQKQTPIVMDLTNSPPLRKTATEKKLENHKITNESVEKAVEKPAEKPVSEEKKMEKPPLEKDYEELINACRRADPSSDMERLIENKLLRYYYSVHIDFVKSRGFRKTLCSAIENINKDPDCVYFHVNSVVEELNVRRKSKEVVSIAGGADSPASGSNSNSNNAVTNKHTEEQIKKLNKALYILKKRIYRLEESEVDWDDEDSTYLQVERFKKRACQIYEKICDLTGESKNAHRLAKRRIQFNGTVHNEFNKTLQAYINQTKEFPDFFDVLRMLEHCDQQYEYKLASFEMKRIAQDAFLKVGKLLQSRRKTELYETVSHFTANTEDPAKSDPTLLAKLNENKKSETRIRDILDKFARAQEDPDMAAGLIRHKNEATTSSDVACEENGVADIKSHTKSKEDAEDFPILDDKPVNNDATDDDFDKDEEDDDDEDDVDDDDEEDGNLDEHVEKLAKDNTVDISDDEVEIVTNDVNDQKLELELETKSKAEHLNVPEKSLLQKDLKLTENNNIMRTKTTNKLVDVKVTIPKQTTTTTATTATATFTRTNTTTAGPTTTIIRKIIKLVNPPATLVAAASIKKTINTTSPTVQPVIMTKPTTIATNAETIITNTTTTTTTTPNIKIQRKSPLLIGNMSDKIEIKNINNLKSKQIESKIAAKSTITTTTTTTTNNTTQAQKVASIASKPQRTIAEIVISDEE